jgi:hypothetical protein
MYKVKVIGKETTINSVVLIHIDEATGKISKVEDKWDGKLPDSSIANVSAGTLLSPGLWFHYAEGWTFYGFSFIWYTKGWEVRYLLRYLPYLFATYDDKDLLSSTFKLSRSSTLTFDHRLSEDSTLSACRRWLVYPRATPRTLLSNKIFFHHLDHEAVLVRQSSMAVLL